MPVLLQCPDWLITVVSCRSAADLLAYATHRLRVTPNSLTDRPPLQQQKMMTCNSDFGVILVSCVNPPYVCPVDYRRVVAIQVALTTLCQHDSLLTHASAEYYATAVCYIEHMSLILQ